MKSTGWEWLTITQLAAVARSCASVIDPDPVEQTSAAVHACAVAPTLGNDPNRPLNSDQFLRRLTEIGGSAFAGPLDIVRQLSRDASPSAAAQRSEPRWATRIECGGQLRHIADRIISAFTAPLISASTEGHTSTTAPNLPLR